MQTDISLAKPRSCIADSHLKRERIDALRCWLLCCGVREEETVFVRLEDAAGAKALIWYGTCGKRLKEMVRPEGFEPPTY